MGKLDLSKIEPRTGSGYPEPHRAAVAGRSGLRLGAAGGLTQFGVNLITLAPGAWSSQRHWHLNEDEFVMVTAGELTLITDAGEEVMRAGDCAAFPAGMPDGHHLVNRSDAPGSFLVVGTRAAEDECTYPDIDMKAVSRGGVHTFLHKDGSRFDDDTGGNA
ncbi:cupin domain-containing protein [Rhodobacteraceae bacterium 2CG4]|uniref:Cupin domain-containing protein n=1 Tax=Halovulum marinum TaxID=2662447 RepID=A0A6L5Z3E2_9RHOB|nr:cupin domain-containing protein [Halovulum marinum]MSU91076.1 cupin domain-containing protein [Halovulum marinum]